jgi:hypothetical protein
MIHEMARRDSPGVVEVTGREEVCHHYLGCKQVQRPVSLPLSSDKEHRDAYRLDQIVHPELRWYDYVMLVVF